MNFCKSVSSCFNRMHGPTFAESPRWKKIEACIKNAFSSLGICFARAHTLEPSVPAISDAQSAAPAKEPKALDESHSTQSSPLSSSSLSSNVSTQSIDKSFVKVSTP